MHVYIYPNLPAMIDLVWFYGIPTSVGYFMLNPIYTYILLYRGSYYITSGIVEV